MCKFQKNQINSKGLAILVRQACNDLKSKKITEDEFDKKMCKMVPQNREKINTKTFINIVGKRRMYCYVRVFINHYDE